MTRPYDIIAFGDTCVDLILRDDDIVPRFRQVENVIADYQLVMGGSCCIFAAGAAKLGLRVGLLGKLGDDAFGALIRRTLECAGVDTRHLATDPRLQTGLTAHLTQADDRAMLTVPGTATALTASDVADEFLASARHLHLGSLFLQTGLLADWIDIARRAKALGLTVSLDTNWDPSETWDFGLERALPLIDVLLPNEQEALKLTGARTWEAAADILQPRVGTLVIKRGAEGAVAWRNGQTAVQTAYPARAGGRRHWRGRQLRRRFSGGLAVEFAASDMSRHRLSLWRRSRQRDRRRSRAAQTRRPSRFDTLDCAVAIRSAPIEAASHATILESKRPQFRRIVQIAPVDQDRLLHRAQYPRHIQVLELVPGRQDQQRVGAVGRGIRIFAQRQTRQVAAGVIHRHRIISAHRRALIQQRPAPPSATATRAYRRCFP